jgi:cytoskeleton protein RodZ
VGEELLQVAESLRIRLCHLEAIESGRFNELPGPAYTLGFVRTYANHLGLDGKEVIRRLRAETQIFEAKPQLSFPVPRSTNSVPSGAVIMVGVVVAVVAYGAYLAGFSREGGQIARISPVPERLARDSGRVSSPPSLATAVVPPSAASFAAAPSQLATPAPATPAPAPRIAANPGPTPPPRLPSPTSVAAHTQQVAVATPAPPAPPPPPARPRIEVRAKADSWIQVRDSGANEMLLTRLLREGETYTVPDRAGLSLLTGNAGALEIRVDGEPVPALGPEGAVRRSIALDANRLKQGNPASE